MQPSQWKYLIVWEFRVRDTKSEEFEERYGSDGAWVTLFRRSSDYLGTELVRDAEQRGRYVTLDFWTSRHAYDAFRNKYAAEYKEIDAQCESLTEAENKLGEFEPADEG